MGTADVTAILATPEDTQVRAHSGSLETASPEFPKFEPTELALADAAKAWIEAHGGFVIHDGDRFLWFDGDRFCGDDGNAKLQEFFKAMVRQGGSPWTPADRARMGRRASIGGAMSLTASALHVDRSTLDANDFLLPCPGGVTVDLETGKVRRSSPADRMTKRAGVTPDFSMPIPQFMAFLDQVSGGDKDFPDFIQKLFGYLLTGSTKEQKLFYIVGPGGGGKSTLIEMIRHVLGDFAVMTEAATFAEQRYEPHPAALAALDGARAVFAPEFEGRCIDASKAKAFTGDAALSVRGMRENFRQVRVTGKLVTVGNSEPQLRTVDEAIRRRFVLFHFNSPPAKADSGLLAKLKAEAPGILAWAIRGARAWLDAGELCIPASIAKASADYLDDQDSFGSWVEEHLDVGDRLAFTASADLFNHWKPYTEGANEATGTAKAFGSRLRKLGLQSGSTRVSGRGVKGWYGCKLRSVTP